MSVGPGMLSSSSITAAADDVVFENISDLPVLSSNPRALDIERYNNIMKSNIFRTLTALQKRLVPLISLIF